MVPAAEMEAAVRDEESELLGDGPAHVARLAASTRFGLGDRPLDGDDDLAQVDRLTWREDEIGRRRLLAKVGPLTLVGRERRGRQQGEREDVRRFGSAHRALVQSSQLGVVAQDQPDVGGGWCPTRIERSPDVVRQSIPGDRRLDAGAGGDLDTPGRPLVGPRHRSRIATARGPSKPAHIANTSRESSPPRGTRTCWVYHPAA